MDAPGSESVRKLLASAGVSASRIEPVSESVYRIEADTGLQYGKVFPPEKTDYFRTIDSLDTDIGVPRGRVLSSNEFGIHLMSPASGTLLSYVLPKYLLPIRWSLEKSELCGGMAALGRYLARLHTETNRGKEQVPIDSLHLDKFGVIVDGNLCPELRDILGSDVTEPLDRILDRHQTLTVDHSLVHGDLILRHIYYNSGDVSVIDLDRTTVASSLTDVVSFRCSLELMSRRLPYSTQGQFKQLFNSFDSRYEQSFPAEQVALFTLIKYCSLLLYYVRRTKPFWRNPSLSLPQLTRDIDIFVLKRRIRDQLNAEPLQ